MRRVVVWALTVILVIIGLGLLGGGAVLITDGGSPYYLAAGIAILASALALLRRSGAASLIYAGLLITTLAWSLWEVGLDGWQLAPRLIMLALVGLLFMIRPVTSMPAMSRWWIAGPVLGIVAVIGLAFGLQAELSSDSPPTAAAAAYSAAGPTEWRNWGNTVGGTRYVPVSQIDTSNVRRLELAWQYDSRRPPQAIPSFEATPLAADGRLYVCLQPGIVAAIDQDTGREIWRYTMPDFGKIDFNKLWGGKCRQGGRRASRQA